MSRIIRTVGPYFGVIPVFLYLLYVVGRTYISSYLNQLGIPAEAMNFDIDDYIYYGLGLGNIILTVSFTVIFVGFIRYIRFRPDDEERRKKEKAKLTDKFALWQIFIFFVYYAAVFTMVGFLVSGSDTPLNPALILSGLMVCIVFMIWSFFFLYNTRVITWIKIRKKASKVFLIALLVQLALFPIIGSAAWGAFSVNYIDNQFPKIQIESLSQISDIQWVNSSHQTFISNEDLYWVIGDGERLILKSSSGNFYLIDQEDILSINFQSGK